jgi:hypothetical protein
VDVHGVLESRGIDLIYGMLFMVVSKAQNLQEKNQFLASQVHRTSLVPDLKGLSSYTTIRRKLVSTLLGWD